MKVNGKYTELTVKQSLQDFCFLKTMIFQGLQ